MKPPRSPESWNRAVRHQAVLAYCASRLLIAIAAAAVLVAIPSMQGRAISSIYTVWDGAWYLHVAEHGYLPGPEIQPPVIPPGADTSFDGAVAYLPLYPTFVAGLDAVVPFSVETVAVGLALFFGATAAVSFARLGAEMASAGEVRRAVTLFCFFPG